MSDKSISVDCLVNNDEQRAAARAKVAELQAQPSLAARLAAAETTIIDLMKDLEVLKKKVG